MKAAIQRLIIKDKMQLYEKFRDKYPKGTQEYLLCEGKAFGLMMALEVIGGSDKTDAQYLEELKQCLKLHCANIPTCEKPLGMTCIGWTDYYPERGEI
jgi:hypothetical protein